jgi:parvulin-like peptidyl-prolyl isomerase
MELADRLGKMPLTTWEGPFQTARGYLFVRVTQREAETEMPFDQIRAALVAKWRYEMIRREIATATKRLREKYRVILPDDVR